jgi:hypothetical protein
MAGEWAMGWIDAATQPKFLLDHALLPQCGESQQDLEI